MPGGLGNNYMANQAIDAAHSAQQGAQRAENQLAHLRKDVTRLLLITEALWILLKDKHGYSDETLTNLITDIEARDAQGRTPAEPCPHCGRNLAKHLSSCMYCGKPVIQNPFAR